MRALTIFVLTSLAMPLLAQEPTKQEVALFRKAGQTARVDIDVKIDGSWQRDEKGSKKERLRHRTKIALVDEISEVAEKTVKGRRRYLKFERDETGLKTDPEQAGATFEFVMHDDEVKFDRDLGTVHSRACLEQELLRAGSLGLAPRWRCSSTLGASATLDLMPLLSLLMGLDERLRVTETELEVSEIDAKSGEVTITGKTELRFFSQRGLVRMDWTGELALRLVLDPNLGQVTGASLRGPMSLTGREKDVALTGQARFEATCKIKTGLDVSGAFKSRFRQRDVTRFIQGSDLRIEIPSSWHEARTDVSLGLAYANRRLADGDDCVLYLELGRLESGDRVDKDWNRAAEAATIEFKDMRIFVYVYDAWEPLPVPGSSVKDLVCNGIYGRPEGVLLRLAMTAPTDCRKKAEKKLKEIRKSLVKSGKG